jgi:arylsulfatase
LKAVGLGAAALAAPRALGADAPLKAADDRPNIVLIMADDMGFSDVGCYGGEIKTPNIDALAAGGIRFTQFHNNAKCNPTRATLLTGLYSQQIGEGDMRGCATVAEALGAAGYRTIMAGKWHAPKLPTDRGFDRYFGLADGCCNYFNPGEQRPGEPEPGRKSPGERRRWGIEDKSLSPYTPEDKNFYTTDAFTDYAIKCLDQYASEAKPFLLYLAYTAPHYPLHAWPEDIAKYRGNYMIGWDELRKRRYARQIEMGLFDSKTCRLSPRDEKAPDWESVTDKDAWDLKMAVYAAMIDRMDQNIGRVMAKIRQLGKAENTLVMFLADNGGCSETINKGTDPKPGGLAGYHTVDAPWANASNTPFRKYKSTDYEGGACTPLIAQWPRRIKNGGRITTQLGHIIDIVPTCLDVAGAPAPKTLAGKSLLPPEGVSLMPALEGKAIPDRTDIFCTYGGYRAMWRGKWKLLSGPPKKPWELYDMSADRTELDDQAGKCPDTVKEMSAAYEAWQQRCREDDQRSAPESIGDKAKPAKGSRSAKGSKKSPPKQPKAE